MWLANEAVLTKRYSPAKVTKQARTRAMQVQARKAHRTKWGRP